MQEIWKDIENYEGIYQVSNFGRVRGLERIVKRGDFYLKIKGQVIKSRSDKDGYRIVNLSINNSKKTFKIHNLVLNMFRNYKKIDGFVIDHIYNDKTNNKLDNLQVITQRENTSKDKKFGTSKYIGVTWNKKDSRWKSCIRINGKQKYLGYFTDEIEAAEAYQIELNKLHFGN